MINKSKAVLAVIVVETFLLVAFKHPIVVLSLVLLLPVMASRFGVFVIESIDKEKQETERMVGNVGWQVHAEGTQVAQIDATNYAKMRLDHVSDWGTGFKQLMNVFRVLLVVALWAFAVLLGSLVLAAAGIFVAASADALMAYDTMNRVVFDFFNGFFPKGMLLFFPLVFLLMVMGEFDTGYKNQYERAVHRDLRLQLGVPQGVELRMVRLFAEEKRSPGGLNC